MIYAANWSVLSLIKCNNNIEILAPNALPLHKKLLVVFRVKDPAAVVLSGVDPGGQQGTAPLLRSLPSN